jgi:methylated-DNA-protein-cysteine methyltransferase-like protein
MCFCVKDGVFIDTVCGCGNFLIITYMELRLLELEILQMQNGGRQMILDVSLPLKVGVGQFYGIEYEEGKRLQMTFSGMAYEIVARIPYGKVASYGQIARMLGAPGSARGVGWAMRRCPERLPWHRVVMSDGAISGGEHAKLRRARLEGERVTFMADGRVNMKACQWDGAAPASVSVMGWPPGAD